MKKPEFTLPSSAAFESELQSLSPAAQAWLYAHDDEQLKAVVTMDQTGEPK